VRQNPKPLFIRGLQCQGCELKISVTGFCHEPFPTFDADAVIQKMMANKAKFASGPYADLDAQSIKAMWSERGKEAADAGTWMHEQCERFFNEMPYSDRPLADGASLAFEGPKAPPFFLEFCKAEMEAKNLVPFRTEQIVYSADLRLAGSIDFQAKDADGNIVIFGALLIRRILFTLWGC
jgi:hypothetical protein